VAATIDGGGFFSFRRLLVSAGIATPFAGQAGAAGQRVAMRENGTPYYLLTDHLGSTAVTANSSGGKTGELRYYPYGGTRYTWGSTPTSLRFTGQREDAAIGLYFYNARYYDPYLGRFISADTVVPNPGNPQSLNRYAYVLGNPLRLVDPSGHKYCDSFDANGRCVSENEAFWVRFRGGWGGDYMVVVQSGAEKVGAALAGVLNGSARERRVWIATGDRPVTAQEAFQLVYGNNRLVFRHIEGDPIGGWAETHLDWAGNGCYRGEICYDESIFIGSGLASFQRWGPHNVVHELGHGIDQRGGRQARADLAAEWTANPDFPHRDPDNRQRRGYAGLYFGWQQTRVATAGEEFADMFLGWTYNRWDASASGATRSGWMSANMPRWIALAVAGD